MGVSYFRPLGCRLHPADERGTGFDENGEGLVLRGHDFHWDEGKQGRSPHLSEEMAGEIDRDGLEAIPGGARADARARGGAQDSRFEPAERYGFEQALSSVDRYDLLALRDTSESRLVRAGRYPPLRGTSFSLGDISFLTPPAT